MDQLEKSKVIEDIQENILPLAQQDLSEPYTIVLYLRALEAILVRLNMVFNYEKAIQNPQNIAELHAMRIAAKWLRYTLV